MSDRQDPPQGYRPRILVAEDDPDLRRLFGMTLEREGYRVEDDHTGSGLYERLVRLRAEGDPPALILSDVHLPGIDGLRLLECVRSWGWTLPVVMVSGLWDDLLRARARTAGATVVLAKPISMRELSVLIGQLAPRRRLPQAAESD